MRIVAAVLFWLAVFAAPATAQTKLALVIGNSNYSALPKLGNPSNDARLLGKQLETAGFRVSLHLDLSQTGMKSALSDFAREVEEAGADTIAMLYFAGHGVQIEGVNYLVPVDVAGESAPSVIVGSVSTNDVLKMLELARAKVNVIVLDACRNNPFKAASRSFSRGLARVDAPPGSLIAYSTAPGQVALDGDGQNSPYAEALAKQLSEPGQPLEAVFRNVRIEVSQKTAGSQVPWEETSLTQEVVLTRSAAPIPTKETAPRPVAGGVGASSEIDATRSYQLAVGKNTIEAYDDFIRQFPKSKEASQAMRNLEMLNDEANWRRAEQQNTLGSYRIYLNLHPKGAYEVEANTRIASLSSAPAAASEPRSPAPEVSPARPAPQIVEAQGFDIFGDDGATLRNISFADCSAACEQDGGCVAVSYRPDLNRCYMKRTALLLVKNAKSAVAVKPEAQSGMRTSNFEIAPQVDLPGFDIGGYRLNSAQDCLQLCEQTSSCRAFSFATKASQCWLKSGYGRSKTAPAIVSGFRP